jgi:hypothetical protein
VTAGPHDLGSMRMLLPTITNAYIMDHHVVGLPAPVVGVAPSVTGPHTPPASAAIGERGETNGADEAREALLGPWRRPAAQCEVLAGSRTLPVACAKWSLTDGRLLSFNEATCELLGLPVPVLAHCGFCCADLFFANFDLDADMRSELNRSWAEVCALVHRWTTQPTPAANAVRLVRLPLPFQLFCVSCKSRQSTDLEVAAADHVPRSRT